MSFYSTFFLCEPERLPTGFPEWKLPLSEPVARTVANPFTGEERTITTREPEWEDFDPENMEMPDIQAVGIEGDYETYLENRIPPFVQSQPHLCAKNLTSVELTPLVAAATNIDGIKIGYALYAHPSLCAGLMQIPDEFIAQIKNADEATLNDLAEQWAARMSNPEYTHSLNGDRLKDDWNVDDAVSLLKPIAELAKQQTAGQSMYLLIEM